MQFLLFSFIVLTLDTFIFTVTARNCSSHIHHPTAIAGTTGGVQNLTKIPRATISVHKPTTTTRSSATGTAVYATTTAVRPGGVASGTTRKCGKYYEVQPGDTCQVIALKQKIDLQLFKAINPEINPGCTNLFLGEYYCILPTADWDSTATAAPIIVPAPTTVPSGTTTKCYEYYIIKSGDFCAKVESLYDITFAQLQAWNPSLKTDCSNLFLGEAYCVDGALKAKRAVAVLW